MSNQNHNHHNHSSVFSKEEKLLLWMLRNALSEGDSDTSVLRAAPETYERMFVQAQRHAVAPLLYDMLARAKGVPDEVLAGAKAVARQTVLQSFRLSYQTALLQKWFAQAQLEWLLLKGVYTASLYPVPELRKSGDIDILVKNEADLERAGRILQMHGCEISSTQHAIHHREYVTPEHITIEVHGMLAEPFDNDRINTYCQSIIPAFFAHREKRELLGYSFAGASVPYDAFYLLLHMLQHFLRAGFGLKLLCDWVVFWNRDIAESDQKQFLRLLRESRTEGFARFVTAVCVRYLGLNHSNVEFMEISRISREKAQEFMLEVLEAEQFGKSGNDRMVALRGTSPMDYFREFHHQMRLNNPNCGKIYVLWPFLWIKTLAVFLYNNKKLRKTSSIAIIRKAGQRGRMIDEMELFQK